MSARPALRRQVALLGVLVVLLQAILFGWHSHPLPLAPRVSQPIAVAANGAVPLSPADAEDGCDICAALHHLSASPIEFVSLPIPRVIGSAVDLTAVPFRIQAPDRGFHARGPPRGSDDHV